MKEKKPTMEEHIQFMAALYRNASYPEQRKAYDEYIHLVILEEPAGEQSRLEEMWQWEIE